MASVISASTTSATALNMSADTTGVLQLATGATPTTAVTINTSQNVGIGTSSPSAKLHVSGISLGNSNIRLTNTFTSGRSWELNPYASGVSDVPFTIRDVTAGADRITIDSSGNVGIGTSSPVARLHARQDQDGTTRAIIQNRNASGTPISELTFITGGFDLSDNRYAYINSAGGSSTYLAFGTGNGATPTERMRIDSSGYVRVNNTSGIDGQFSSVAGAWYAGAFANTDATYATVYSWNKATSGNNLFYQFYTETAAALRGSIDYNRAGNAVRYNTSSDERLKENIVDAPSAIDLINSVKIRSFDWKETGFHVDYGVIAQELNEVVPDAVSEGLDNEDGTIKQAWGVDTSVLVPALVKAIQEQQTIINDLKARIETLEAK